MLLLVQSAVTLRPHICMLLLLQATHVTPMLGVSLLSLVLLLAAGGCCCARSSWTN
jgi:hypothetical protein